MNTVPTSRRSAVKKEENVSQLNIAALGKAIDAGLFTSYGGNEPLYKIDQAFGLISPINTVDTPFETHSSLAKGTKAGECAFSYNPELDAFSIGVNVDGTRIVYSSVQHDKAGSPLELDEFKLCQVTVTRDFKVEGEVIMMKGKTLLKALDPAYVGA